MTGSSPKSPLTPHVRIPRRAVGDRRLRERDIRVLGAVCRAVNSKTGASLIRQKRMAELTGYHRNTVHVAIEHLVECGYLEKILRGRRSRGYGKGRFKTNLYLVIYYDPDFDAAQTKPGMADAHSA